jgi:hypothetical protein
MAIGRPLAVLVVAVTCLLIAGDAQATGWWNMPGTFCQWNGCGFGGGYHAPLVLGPLTHECWEGPNEVRMPQAPNPYSCSPCYGATNGCGSCNQAIGTAPTQASPAPVPARSEATQRPLFGAPVQY